MCALIANLKLHNFQGFIVKINFLDSEQNDELVLKLCVFFVFNVTIRCS